MKKRAIVIIPLLLVILAAGPEAQDARNATEPHLEFGPVRLVAGMPRERAIALLAEAYMISPWRNPEGMDTWGVADRQPNEHGSHPLVGYVSFEAGKLLRAGKHWPHDWPHAGADYGVVHTISNVLDRFREEGISNCSVSTRKQNQAEGDHDILAINCGSKGVTVDASLGHYQGENVTGVDVYEEIADVSARKR